MSVVDLTYITDVCSGNRESIKELIDIFLEQINEYTLAFTNAYNDKQWLELARLAHRAKSSMSSFGMDKLADDLKTLELVCKHLRLIQLQQLTDDDSRHDAAALVRELAGYPVERREIVCQNLSDDCVRAFIDEFKQQSQLAADELKNMTL